MRLVLVAGQHRNEQSAFLLAPLVADALRSLGHTVMLYTNPEVRIPLEVVKENYHAGKTMTEEQWEALIFGWEEQVCEKYMEFPVFCLHNYPRNPTLFESPEENATYLQLLSGTFPHLGVGENEAYPLARLCYFSGTDGTQIEIPALYRETLTEEERIIYQKTLPPGLLSLSYLLETDLALTKARGWMGKEMVSIVSCGIEYLLHHEVDELYERLERCQEDEALGFR